MAPEARQPEAKLLQWTTLLLSRQVLLTVILNLNGFLSCHSPACLQTVSSIDLLAGSIFFSIAENFVRKFLSLSLSFVQNIHDELCRALNGYKVITPV